MIREPRRVGVYLAAAAAHHAEIHTRAGELEALGYRITSRWHASEADERHMTTEQRGELADRCLRDVEDADILVAFTEPPDTTFARGGRHVEVGYALGLDMRIVVVGYLENVFHCLEGVQFFATWPEALARLAEAHPFDTAPVSRPSIEERLEGLSIDELDALEASGEVFE